MSTIDAEDVAKSWLSAFGDALSAGNVGHVTSLFVPNGYLRDSLVFSWDCRTSQSRDQIDQFLSDKVTKQSFSNFELDTSSPHLSPAWDKSFPGFDRINAFFVFETELARCRAAVSLVETDDDGEARSWKALSVFTSIVDWKGHEEAMRMEAVVERDESAESNPTVLIVGAGQSGLQLASRLHHHGISCLILEKERRVGDNWRNRYPSLKLHVPKVYCQLLYQNYPSNYPEYIPKDLLANWLEGYALSQSLNVWTSSTMENKPSYDATSKVWTVQVSKGDEHSTLHPKHLVMALGPFGSGIIPRIEGQETFRGSQAHSEYYRGGKEYAKKRVVVIGAGNSASDICLDLSDGGAESVTLCQRSPTVVHSSKYIRSLIGAFFPENVPIDITDLKMDATPVKLMLESLRAMQNVAREHDKEMLDELTNSGLKLYDGPTGAGYVELGLTRGGGYFFDSGFASSASGGFIKVKSNAGIARLNEMAVVFSDGSQLDTDAIIYATGFSPVRETYKRLLGEEKAVDIWDLDKEGEVRGVFRPTGHPGLWYAAGDFSFSRRYSKRLALLIKASELGYYVS